MIKLREQKYRTSKVNGVYFFSRYVLTCSISLNFSTVLFGLQWCMTGQVTIVERILNLLHFVDCLLSFAVDRTHCHCGILVFKCNAKSYSAMTNL